MAADLFDQLAEVEVPPPPGDFDRSLHARLNQSLVAQHVVDFGLNALPATAVELLRAVLGMVAFSITGEFPARKNSDGDLKTK
jgi:hypothetical protein